MIHRRSVLRIAIQTGCFALLYCALLLSTFYCCRHTEILTLVQPILARTVESPTREQTTEFPKLRILKFVQGIQEFR